MRALLVALIACLACSSSSETPKPGASITGTWNATDTANQVMTLDLVQTGGKVTGTGTVGGTPVVVSGTNQYTPCTCLCPCAPDFPISLAIADPTGDTLHAIGPLPEVSVGPELQLQASLTGPPPGFPFTAGGFTLFKQ